MTIQRHFRVRTCSEIFEADHFDWGEPDGNGDQYFSFFDKGTLSHRIHIKYVLEIAEVTRLRHRSSVIPRERPTLDFWSERERFLNNSELLRQMSQRQMRIAQELQTVLDAAVLARAETQSLREKIKGLARHLVEDPRL